MAKVGSEPPGTRVVLFKQSSFLFSHHTKEWKNADGERMREKSPRKKCHKQPLENQNQLRGNNETSVVL